MKRTKQTVNSKIRNATRLEIDGNKFRSKLEAFTYNKLIENDITDFEYEKVKFILQPAFTFTSTSFEAYEKTDRDSKVKTRGFGETKKEIREMTYLPDFVCIDAETKTGWIIEDKGYGNDSWPMKLKMFKRLLTEEGFNIDLYIPNNQGNVLKTIQMIKDKYYSK